MLMVAHAQPYVMHVCGGPRSEIVPGGTEYNTFSPFFYNAFSLLVS